jgi:hypothetical protein
MINKRNIIICSVVLVLLIAGGSFAYLKFHSQPIIPTSVSKRVNYVIFYPAKNPKVVLEKNTIKYTSSEQLVSYIVNFNGALITFSEQSSPSTFVNDTSLYPEFISKLNGINAFVSVNGTVNITHPQGSQYETAVMNAKGTLLFAQSTNKDISQSNWQLLFNNLLYTRPV